MENALINSLWVLICAGFVFAMQAGFLCLETGLTRSKNAINVAIKNATDFSVSLLLFWVIGFAFMFGDSIGGWVGWSQFRPPLSQCSLDHAAFFLFQAMFCATAATIVSGAVAERMRFAAYVLVTVVVSGVIYPVFGHWAWGGTDELGGWLRELGFVDFAGSTVVHGIGGWAGLAAVMVIGPRTGRFDGNVQRKISGSNAPMAMLGVLLLWFGWIGFNGGSTLEMNEHVGGIICNTLLSGTVGMIVAMAVGCLVRRRPDVSLAINGSLAGLVAITAGCNAVSTLSAVVIGGIGALVMMSAQWILDRRRIDDAIGAVAVHCAAGIWGTLAVALLGIPELLDTGMPRSSQLVVQFIGVASAGAMGFGVTFVLLRTVNYFVPLRVSPLEERIGLNIVEHGESTEVTDLLIEMESQRASGDFSARVNVEPFAEVGQIALQYNRVIDRVAEEVKHSIELTDRLKETEMQTRAIVDSALDCIISIDGDGMIIEFNPAAERMFDCCRVDVDGRSIASLFPGDRFCDRSMTHLMRSSECEMVQLATERTETTCLRSDGSEIPVEMAIVISQREPRLILTVYLRDLTAQKRADSECEEMHRRIVESSRQAGMAEVATGVLHNVGNVLNSVNVSANLLVERVESSRVSSLAKASGVLLEHCDDLEEFLTRDERGKNFPRLLEELVGKLSSERDSLREELSSLIENIEHIKEVISMQQTFACVGGITEEVDVAKLVEDACKINDAGLARHDVTVDRDFGDAPPIVTEKHKVLQILVNLISNAKHALTDSGRSDRTMSLSIETDGEEVSIEVRDNGVGIAQENLQKVFSHGYTTKKDGHGFGLHTCAITAQELGGSLSAHSHGIGQGATFRLKLPITQEILCEL